MLSKYLHNAFVEKKNETELTVTFRNGSVLAIKGADDPDSLRGPNPFGVILDEYELMKQNVWEEVIAPIMFARQSEEIEFNGNKMVLRPFTWFMGTPKPEGAHFKALHEKAKESKNWFALELNVDDSKILSQEMIDIAKESMTEAAFEQEFMLKWFTDGGVVFRGVDKIVSGNYEEKQYDKRIKYVFGVDLAMHVDWTVAIGINLFEKKVEVFDRYNQIDYNLQKARLEAMLRRFGNPTANVDQTGVGEPIVQDLQQRGLNINGITITEPMKRELVTNLAIFIEQELIKIPNIPELVHELKIFGFEINERTKRIRYSAPEGEHDDCVMALALACWQMPKGVVRPKYDTITGFFDGQRRPENQTQYT